MLIPNLLHLAKVRIKKLISCFEGRVVTLVADNLRRQWLQEVYLRIGD